MYDEEKEECSMVDQELIEAMKALLKPINEKLEDLEDTLNVMRLEQKRTDKQLNKRIEHLEDETETLIAVLEAKDILPKIN